MSMACLGNYKKVLPLDSRIQNQNEAGEADPATWGKNLLCRGLLLYSTDNEDTDNVQGFSQGVTFKSTLATAWKLIEREKSLKI